MYRDVSSKLNSYKNESYSVIQRNDVYDAVRMCLFNGKFCLWKLSLIKNVKFLPKVS
jgi:hypothetical protein